MNNTPEPPIGRILKVVDGISYWLMPDGSHWGLTPDDARLINDSFAYPTPDTSLLSSAENTNHTSVHVIDQQQQREISDNYELTQRLEESLAYFCDEFPKDQCPDIWVKPISHHCGGITPNDLQALLSILYAARKPVSIKECCIAAARSDCTGPRDHVEEQAQKYWGKHSHTTKAVLDAAGVKYVD